MPNYPEQSHVAEWSIAPAMCIACFLALAAGCTSSAPSRAEPACCMWAGEGEASQATLERDSARCEYEIESTLAGAPTPHVVTRPGAGPYERGMAPIGGALARQGQADNLYRSCMRAKGWRWYVPG